MSRFAIATNFENRRGFFAGGLQVVPATGHFSWLVVDDSAAAFQLPSKQAADAVARGLDQLAELSGAACTWYTVELPELPRASIANAPRPVPSSAGERDA